MNDVARDLVVEVETHAAHAVVVLREQEHGLPAPLRSALATRDALLGSGEPALRRLVGPRVVDALAGREGREGRDAHVDADGRARAPRCRALAAGRGSRASRRPGPVWGRAGSGRRGPSEPELLRCRSASHGETSESCCHRRLHHGGPPPARRRGGGLRFLGRRNERPDFEDGSPVEDRGDKVSRHVPVLALHRRNGPAHRVHGPLTARRIAEAVERHGVRERLDGSLVNALASFSSSRSRSRSS